MSELVNPSEIARKRIKNALDNLNEVTRSFDIYVGFTERDKQAQREIHGKELPDRSLWDTKEKASIYQAAALWEIANSIYTLADHMIGMWTLLERKIDEIKKEHEK